MVTGAIHNISNVVIVETETIKKEIIQNLSIMCTSTGKIMLVVAAMIMMVGNGSNTYVLFSCSFITDTNSGETVGLFLKEIDNEYGFCSPPLDLLGEDDDVFDDDYSFWTDVYMWLARVSGLISCMIGFILWIALWSSMCCPCSLKRRCRITFGIFALSCAILAGGMFFAFGYSDCSGEKGCSLGFSSTVNIVTIVFYFTASMLCFFAPTDETYNEPMVPPTASENNYNEDENQQNYEKGQTIPYGAPTAAIEDEVNNLVIETTTNADGTTVTKKITANPDGSKTVEETVVSPARNTANKPDTYSAIAY